MTTALWLHGWYCQRCGGERVVREDACAGCGAVDRWKGVPPWNSKPACPTCASKERCIRLELHPEVRYARAPSIDGCCYCGNPWHNASDEEWMAWYAQGPPPPAGSRNSAGASRWARILAECIEFPGPSVNVAKMGALWDEALTAAARGERARILGVETVAEVRAAIGATALKEIDFYAGGLESERRAGESETFK